MATSGKSAYKASRTILQSALCVIALILLSLGFYFINIESSAIEKKDALLRGEVINQGELATQQISRRFNEIKQGTQDIADLVEKSNLSDLELRNAIEAKVLAIQGAFRGGLAFKKDAFPAEPLYSPYYQKGAQNVRHQQLSDRYDYTQPDKINGDTPRTFWFHEPLKKGPMWMEPYYGTSANSWISEFIRPFSSTYDTDDKNGYDGIIFLNFSLSGLSQIVSKLHLGESGFGFILTNQDKLIAYPNTELLGKNIHTIDESNATLQAIAKQRRLIQKHSMSSTNAHMASLKESAQTTSFLHPLYNKESWLFFSKIPNTDNTLGIIVLADELRQLGGIDDPLYTLNFLGKVLIAIAIIMFISAFYLGNFYLGALYSGALYSGALYSGNVSFPKTNDSLTKQRGFFLQASATTQIAFLFSIVFLMTLISLWTIKLDDHRSAFSTVPVYEAANVDNLLLKYATNDEVRNANQIKTSKVYLSISNLRFLDSTTLQIVGELALENNSQGKSANYEPPTSFPLATETSWESISLDDQYSYWKFITHIQQPFDYSSYPFDQEEIHLTLMGKNQLGQHVLVPEFSHYASIAPTELPGMSTSKADLNGWAVEESYFSYDLSTLHTYSTPTMTLQYNIVIKRRIIGPVITYLFPLLIVSCLAFCTFLLWTKKEEKIALWGFSSSTILEQCAALFFILIISHISLRDELDAKGMIFLEYLYCGAYVQIAFAALSTIRYTSDIKSPTLDFQNGLIIKQLYWPISLLFCITVTLIQFA